MSVYNFFYKAAFFPAAPNNRKVRLSSDINLQWNWRLFNNVEVEQAKQAQILNIPERKSLEFHAYFTLQQYDTNCNNQGI